MKLTAIIEREGDGYVALCPELDIASQGDSIEEVRDNLREAVDLFSECASFEEIKQRFGNRVELPSLELMLLSEVTLAEDWNREEEKEAWQHLDAITG